MRRKSNVKVTKKIKNDKNGKKTAANPRKEMMMSGIKLTHPDRIMGPAQTITKEQIARYYNFISAKILPHLQNRPLVLVRCPSGGFSAKAKTKGKDCFFQKHYSKSFGKHIESIDVGKSADYLTITDKQGLMSLVQFDALEIHPWGSSMAHLEEPDRITFDLDPGPGVPWKKVIEAARIVGRELKKHHLKSFVKTSGGKGLHIVIPILPKYDWGEVRAFSEAFARYLTEIHPDRFVATAVKSKRGGKIFLDYLRNVKDATSVAAYSTRAREGAPLSMPLRWEDLKNLKSSVDYTVLNVETKLKRRKRDPWAGFFSCNQEIPKLPE